MKKIIALVLGMIVVLSLASVGVSANDGYTVLYTEDGRSAQFPDYMVMAQLSVGWYTAPVQRLYAEGKSDVFVKSQVPAQLSVGWYTEPVQRLYAEGKSALFPQSQVALQLSVGWYTEPVQRLYAENKSALFPQSQVASQLSVGWYTEPVQRLYAPGKSALFPQSQVAAQLKVGWSTQPVKVTTQPKQDPTKKKSFLNRAENLEWYEDVYLGSAYSTSEINSILCSLYDEWDALLNEIYAYLKQIMPTKDFKTLESAQIAWVKQKEYAISIAGREFAGGSYEIVEKNSTALSYTKERCYYLLTWLN